MLSASDKWAIRGIMLEDLKPLPSAGSCKVAIIAQSLSDADKKILLDAIADSATWPIKTLRKALQAKGLEISDTPLTNHRAQSCVCFRMA
jgi:hypothetical protein